MFLSIVIPYFDCGAYIYSCLHSISDAIQNRNDIEVIVVDDFNEQSQTKLLESAMLTVRLKNSKIIRPKQNLGLSDARNFGVEHAEGEYIFFLDADDYVNSNNLKKIIDVLQDIKTDIIYFDSHTFRDENSWQAMQKFSFHPRCVIKTDEKLVSQYLNDCTFYAWRFIVRREILKDIKFYSRLYMEDIATTPVILAESKDIWYEPLSVVNYRVRPNSIMNSWKPKKYFDMVLSPSLSLKYLNNKFNNYSQLNKEAEILGFKFFYWAIKDARKVNKESVDLNFYRNIKELYLEKFGEFKIINDVKNLYELYGLNETIKWLILYYNYGMYSLLITPHGNFKYKALRRQLWKNLIILTKVVLPILFTLSLLSNIYYIIILNKKT